MFTWATQAPLHLLPSTQENLNMIHGSFRPVPWARPTFGDFLSPLAVPLYPLVLPTALQTHSGAQEPHLPSSKPSQLLISRNFVNQWTSQWELEISHSGRMYITEISRSFKTARHCPLLHSRILLLHAAHQVFFFLFSPTLHFSK